MAKHKYIEPSDNYIDDDGSWIVEFKKEDIKRIRDQYLGSNRQCDYCNKNIVDTNTDYCKECINHVMQGGR